MASLSHGPESSPPTPATPPPPPGDVDGQLRLSPEESRRLAPLTEFVLALVKALLRTGYYTPDHPESARAMEGLYRQFRSTIGERAELGILLHEGRSGFDVWVEGLLDRPVHLKALLSEGAAEAFIPKLAQFCQRKSLLSFSLKRAIEQREFETFIQILSDPTEYLVTGPEDAAGLTQEIRRRGVWNVSFLFSMDRLRTNRHLVWRVEMCLTRLNKDLRSIPFLRDQSAETVAEFRRQLLVDLMRPLHRPELALELLLNLDVIDPDVLADASKGLTPEEELSGYIADSLVEPMLAESCVLYDRFQLELKHLQKNDVTVPPLVLEETRLRLERIHTIVPFLYGRLQGRAETVRRELFRSGLIDEDQLSEALQAQVGADQEIGRLVAEMPEELRALQAPDSPKELAVRAMRFIELGPELIRRGAAEGVNQALSSFNALLDAGPPWGEVAGAALSKLQAEPFLEAIRARLCADAASGESDVSPAQGSERRALLETTRALGAGGVDVLLDELATSESRRERVWLCERISAIGPVVGAEVERRLRLPEAPWYVRRNLILILGEIKDQSHLGAVQSQLSDDHPRVREEAYRAIARLLGKMAEPFWLKALNDPIPRVRLMAVGQLAGAGNKSQAFVDFCYRTLQKRSGDEVEEDAALQVAVCRVLSHLAPPPQPAIERLFVDALAKEKLKLLARGKQRRKTKPQPVRCALAEALGMMGYTQAAHKILQETSEEGDPKLQKFAAHALRRIETRQAR